MTNLPQPKLSERIGNLSTRLANTGKGSLAALRRGPLEGQGVAAFWALAAKLEVPTKELSNWATIVQCIAILVPKGNNHQFNPRLGTVLFEAGISELRLARLLSARREQRKTLLVRICRRLASSGDHSRFNLIDLAQLILSDKKESLWRVAEDYYRSQATQSKSNAQTKESTS